MNEFIESIRAGLFKWGELTESLLNALSLVCIIIGVIMSLVHAIQISRRNGESHPLHTSFRRIFGGWLIVALEFQLAADIAGTIISPTTAQLVELGAIAVIRTFLNYFLGKELREQTEVLEARVEKKKSSWYKFYN